MELTKEQEILQQVISEAWTNPSFKQELMQSPIDAIKQLTGKTLKLPEGKTLQVFDQSNEDVICLNIPQQPNMDSLELTDQQLELVAGGRIAAVLPGGGFNCVSPWPWATTHRPGPKIPLYDQ